VFSFNDVWMVSLLASCTSFRPLSIVVRGCDGVIVREERKNRRKSKREERECKSPFSCLRHDFVVLSIGVSPVRDRGLNICLWHKAQPMA
jgi:hypothetical protein